MIAVWLACSAPDVPDTRRAPPSPENIDEPEDPVATPGDSVPALADTGRRCAADAAWTGSVCMDRYEAPNVEGETPLVMYTFDESEAWCGARGKRLCFDVEWQAACEGPTQQAWPYGDTWQPGQCNDEETWRVYSQTDLNGWPASASTAAIERLEDQLVAAAAESPAASDEIASLYQAEAAGENLGCGGDFGVYDLVGNVEEWTRRRDGGEDSFHGALKGRYWAESRTCQSTVTTHGDGFRFYEIGFRCCAESPD